MDTSIVLSTRVWLERNFPDIPFDVSSEEDLQETCVSRVMNAITMGGETCRWQRACCEDLTEEQIQSLSARHLLDREQVKKARKGVLLQGTEEAQAILLGAGSHVLVLAAEPGEALQTCATRCFAVEDMLSRHLEFAFDAEFGYLTAAVAACGTGMGA